MKTLTGSARFLAKLALLALAVVMTTLAPTQDSPRVGADHSELYIAPSPASSTHLNNIFLIVGGDSETFYVRAKDVTHDPTGVAGFEIALVYDNDVASVTSIIPDTFWLGSTGRTALCSAFTIRAIAGDPDGLWEALVGCGTSFPLPLGVQGSRLLATFTLTPGSVPSSGPFTNLSFLVNTTGDAAVIPVTVRSSNVAVAYCGDLTGDGVVNIVDIGTMVLHFGENEFSPHWDPNADLNGDGVVNILDIGFIVVQFGDTCVR